MNTSLLAMLGSIEILLIVAVVTLFAFVTVGVVIGLAILLIRQAKDVRQIESRLRSIEEVLTKTSANPPS